MRRVSASVAKEGMVRPEGLEPPAYRFEACRSIQLSYGRVNISVADSYRPSLFPRGKETVALLALCLPRFCHESRQTARRHARRRSVAWIPVTPSRPRADTSRSAIGSCGLASPAHDGSASLLRANGIRLHAASRESAGRWPGAAPATLAIASHPLRRHARTLFASTDPVRPLCLLEC
jgi:hypothetical protein